MPPQAMPDNWRDNVPDFVLRDLPYPRGAAGPHARGNWRGRAAATKALRRLAWAEAASLMGSGGTYTAYPMERAVYTLAFYTKHKRRRDEANLMHLAKPYIDGIVDAGVLADDSTDHLTCGGVRVVCDRMCLEESLTIAIWRLNDKHPGETP